MKRFVFKFKSESTKNKQQKEIPLDEAKFEKLEIFAELAANKNMLEEIFANCSDVVFRSVIIQQKKPGLIIFIDGLVDSNFINDDALIPLFAKDFPDDIEKLEEKTIAILQLSKEKKLSGAVNAILSGNAVLFIEGKMEAIVLNVRGGTRRGVEEPQTEISIRGPREGFTENIRTNTALVRFRIKSHALKMEGYVMGKHTKTNVVLCYLDGLIEERVLHEVKRRLDNIEIDSVLESGYIEELIEDNPYSPFPQLQYTERPDTVAGQLLEGRFAIFVDGTPFVITGPITLWQLLQASEDYNERYIVADLIRWLRMAFVLIALYMPALYVAITTFHQEMLPTTLILSIAASREAIPFPAIVEALIMEIAFEALREAGIRLPKTVGQAVSILGALVIGQAAVEAGIVSAPMVIIVSLTGIASFTIPRFNFAISIRMLRFPLMLFAATFGLFGIIIGSVLIFIHLCALRSFGVPYLSGIAPLQKDELKDILGRAPWWKMDKRPTSIADQNVQRIKPHMKPKS